LWDGVCISILALIELQQHHGEQQQLQDGRAWNMKVFQFSPLDVFNFCKNATILMMKTARIIADSLIITSQEEEEDNWVVQQQQLKIVQNKWRDATL
jgi:hypothetical protein